MADDATIANTVEKAGVLMNNFSIPGAISRNVIEESKTLTFDGGWYATGGIDWEPDAIDAAKVFFIAFETSVAGWQFHWIQATKKLTVWNGTTEYTNDSAISLTTRYFARGYK